jgi:hypothetical protein
MVAGKDITGKAAGFAALLQSSTSVHPQVSRSRGCRVRAGEPGCAIVERESGGFDVPEYDFDELGYMNGVGYLTWGAAVRKYKSLPPAVRGPIFLRPSGSLYKPSDFDRAAEQL